MVSSDPKADRQCFWPFKTREELVKYRNLQDGGYAQLKQAHDLFMKAAKAKPDVDG